MQKIKWREAARSTACIRHSAARRGGFTLVEITVVIAIAGLLTAITVGGINNITASNRRIACQTNLVQIYQACRLYAADESGSFPYYNGSGSTIGLWSLYTFPRDGYPDQIALVSDNKPIERYLRNVKTLHCPNDFANGSLYQNASRSTFNPNYLSYQILDDNGTASDATDDALTYQSTRPSGGSRQLLQTGGRPPADNTVVTWCKWHRTGAGGRDYDNVLFYDGTVQFLPRREVQNSPEGAACPPLPATCTNEATGWKRTPKAPS